MVLIELLSSFVIDHVTFLINSIASAADLTSPLILEHLLLSRCFRNDGFAVSIEVEIASCLMWIEIVLFNVERRWQFASLVKFLFFKHHLTVEVVYYVACLGINQVASLVRALTILVSELFLSFGIYLLY